MAATSCPRCGATNDPEQTGDQCTACGAPLTGRSTAYTDAPAPGAGPGYSHRPDGHEDFIFKKERSDELAQAEQAAKKSASTILFVIAALQVVCGLIPLLIVPQIVAGDPNAAVDPVAVAVAAVVVIGLGIFFAVLGLWARYQPFPAAVVGLVVYLLVTLADMGLSFATADPAQGFRGIIVKVVLIIVLIQAVRAGYKAHRLRVENDF